MIEKTLFDRLDDGTEVYAYKITNRTGANVKILSYGGIVQSLFIPDRNGKLDDIICGFETVQQYKDGGGYQGALIGRYGNRIKAGKFTLDGVEYVLHKNDGGKNHLHGGRVGFNQKIWNVTTLNGDGEDRLILEYISADGEEGYPGELKVTVTYKFTDENVLGIHYEAFTTKNTPCVLTNHTYFNLAGYASCDVNKHRCYIAADRYLELDDELIPTGNILPTEGSIFDYNHLAPMTAEVDNYFCFNNNGNFEKAAEVRENESGRAMEVWTDAPGMQLYTGNMMKGRDFKGGRPQIKHTAFCMETQPYPDAPNHDNFPSAILKVGEKYDSSTEYRFKTV